MILLILGVIAIGVRTGTVECPAYLQGIYNEDKMILKIQTDIAQGTVTNIHHNCAEFLIKQGKYDAAEYLLKEWFVKRKIDIVENVRATVSYVKKEVDRTLSLASNFKKKQKIGPVFRWGQNFTHVLIHVKFAHRFDSPGCLHTWGKNLTLTSDRLFFNCLGIQAETPLEFELDFPLFRPIIPEDSIEKSESVGTMVIHLRKKTKGIWKKLVADKFDASDLKLKIWWELADIYPRAMQKYNQLIDKEDDSKDKEKVGMV